MPSFTHQVAQELLSSLLVMRRMPITKAVDSHNESRKKNSAGSFGSSEPTMAIASIPVDRQRKSEIR